MSIRTVIVDDEGIARRRLRRLLAAYRDIVIVGECSGGASAVETIEREKPALVFLDVQMPDLDGFGVLRELKTPTMPAVIFVTAFDQYALRAFEACATDYLLKPYTTQRFTQAVDRALRWIDSADRTENEERLKRLMLEVLHSHQSTSQPDGRSLDRFVAKRQGRTQFVSTDEVDWIESDGNYIRLHVGTASHLVRGTIANCEERLDPRRFVRVHRRYIVNMERIREVQPWFGGDYVILLKNGQQVRLSRTYREHFQSRMRGS
jgi:two-component system LytT family response regulator